MSIVYTLWSIFEALLFIFLLWFPIRNNWYNIYNNMKSILNILQFILHKSVLCGFIVLGINMFVSITFGSVILGYYPLVSITIGNITFEHSDLRFISLMFIMLGIVIQNCNITKFQLNQLIQFIKFVQLIIYIGILVRINILNIIISNEAILYFLTRIFVQLKQIT